MLQIHEIHFFQQNLKTRFPFRYGIASMEDVPQLFVQAEISFTGGHSLGISADLLPPKWFTKSPDSDYETHDLPEMMRGIQQAAKFAQMERHYTSFFEFWQSLYENQKAWAKENSIAPLLANFGVSLIERAVLDAICRAHGYNLHSLLKSNALKIDFGAIRPELHGIVSRDVIIESPAKQMNIRHTVGMGDPLTEDEIANHDRVDDGLPHSLVANIRAYGLKYFKIKLSGDQQADRSRLIHIAKLIRTEVGPAARFTMDGNENYLDINHFKEDYQAHFNDPILREFFEQGLLFVEQPLHRDYALHESVREELAAWKDAPQMIIDESDADLESLPLALSLGYSGTSHKNCKGIVKGLLNRATIFHARQSGREVILSGEDLANIGPVALLQDLAMAACLGIEHVERNGHHYFAGLSGFPTEIQQQALSHHSDLFHKTESGLIAVNPHEGMISIESVVNAPFGVNELINLKLLNAV